MLKNLICFVLKGTTDKTIVKKDQELSPFQKYLYEDFRKRILDGSLSHIAISLFLIGILFFDLWTFNSPSYLCGFLLIANSVLRYFLFRKREIKNPKSMRIFSSFVIIQGFLWGGWVSQITVEFGVYSPLGVTFVVVLSGVIAAAIYSLGKLKLIFSFFVLACLSAASIGFFSHSQPEYGDFKVPVIFVIFYLFLLRNQSMIAQQIKELYFQQNQIRDLLDQLPAAISVVEKDTYIQANKALLDLVGLTQEQLVKQKVRLHDSKSELIKNAITVLNSNLQSLTFECDLFSKAENKKIPHIVTIKKSTINENTVVITSLDIRKIKEKENELTQQKILLQQASKMASLGEMASGLAHEINNPLSIIMVRSGLIEKELKKENPDKAKILTDSQKINTTVLRISKIINGLRTFARDATSEPVKEVLLQEIIDDTLSFCEEKFKLNNVIIQTVINEKYQAKCRPIQVSQAILNALNNSFDAIKSRDESDRWIRIEVSEVEGFAECRIIDSGTGLSPEVADKVFQPFFTTKEVGQGTGLGMSISKGLIESQQGQLFFDLNSPNTCLVLRLPLAKEPAQVA